MAFQSCQQLGDMLGVGRTNEERVQNPADEPKFQFVRRRGCDNGRFPYLANLELKVTRVTRQARTHDFCSQPLMFLPADNFLFNEVPFPQIAVTLGTESSIFEAGRVRGYDGGIPPPDCAEIGECFPDFLGGRIDSNFLHQATHGIHSGRRQNCRSW